MISVVWVFIVWLGFNDSLVWMFIVGLGFKDKFGIGVCCMVWV